MRVGWIGLGRLGLPCALALADAGHDVTGYDVNPLIRELWSKGGGFDELGYVEPGVNELADRVGGAPEHLQIADTVEAVVRGAEVVFVAVQTPHAPEYGGTTPVPGDTRDFEYGYLVQAVRDVVRASDGQPLTLAVISTVLPGTTQRLLAPLVHNTAVRLVYSPQFIAMGTTIRDFKAPEFLLLGSNDPQAAGQVSDVFAGVHDAPRVACTIADAEAIKVLYNTYISLKIVWANHMAAVCEATGADADAVVNALELATERILSVAYLRPGMGDGGACHPRDLIALADLERRHDLPPLFTNLAQWRDLQSQRLAGLAVRWAQQAILGRIVLLGLAYKPGVPLIDGSPALLLRHQLRQSWPPELVRAWEPHHTRGDSRDALLSQPAVFVHTTPHEQYREVTFPPGSVVIDPWGSLPQTSPGVVYVRPGRR